MEREEPKIGVRPFFKGNGAVVVDETSRNNYVLGITNSCGENLSKKPASVIRRSVYWGVDSQLVLDEYNLVAQKSKDMPLEMGQGIVHRNSSQYDETISRFDGFLFPSGEEAAA